MVSEEEFGQIVSEFESFRDLILEQMTKLMNRLEEIEEEIKDLKTDLKIPSKKIR